jgi:hypothetical protein
MTVGVIQHDLDRPAPRSLQLRHHLRHQQRGRLRLPARQHGLALEDMVQRQLNYAIVDEVDSILIDEARTPLIISGQGHDATELYGQVRARSSRAWSRTKTSRSTRRRTPFRSPRRASPRSRRCSASEPLRSAQPRADAPAQRRAQGLAPVPQGPAVHRQGRRSHHRRRVHRPLDVRPPLLRRHPPGDRGQGRASRFAARTRRSRRSPSRTISGSTTSSPA